jgi:hypothetical protein
MPDQKPIPNGETEEARIDWHILDLLIDPDEQRPRAVCEIIREHGHEQNALDGLDRLNAAGLIHHIEGYVWASRAAIRYSQIAG